MHGRLFVKICTLVYYNIRLPRERLPCRGAAATVGGQANNTTHRRTPAYKKSTGRRVEECQHHISSHLFNRVSVFLGTGGGSGVHPRSLLLLAGDVETNPGPGREIIDVLDSGSGNELSVEYERLDSSSNSINIGVGNEDMNNSGIDLGNLETQDASCSDGLSSNRFHSDGKEGDQNIASDNREDNFSGRDGCQSDHSESSMSGGEKGPVNHNQDDMFIRVTCFSCNAPFRKQYSPFFCVEPDCLAVCHRQEMCSGLTRTEQKRGGWRCYLHGGRDLRRGEGVDDNHQEPTSFGKCAECDKTLKCGMSPIVCSECPNLSHASCTGMTRDQIIKKRKGIVSWTCSLCCDQDNSTSSHGGTHPLHSKRVLAASARRPFVVVSRECDVINARKKVTKDAQA